MKTKLTYFTDGGHGWLAVKRSMLKELGIIEKITSYSFQKGQTVYLEEDADVTTFAEAVLALPGNEGKKFVEVFDIKTSYSERSPIRSYPRFCTEDAPELHVAMKVSLYGKVYTVTGKTHKGQWLIADGLRTYRISKKQESEVREVKEDLTAANA